MHWLSYLWDLVKIWWFETIRSTVVMTVTGYGGDRSAFSRQKGYLETTSKEFLGGRPSSIHQRRTTLWMSRSTAVALSCCCCCCCGLLSILWSGTRRQPSRTLRAGGEGGVGGEKEGHDAHGTCPHPPTRRLTAQQHAAGRRAPGVAPSAAAAAAKTAESCLAGVDCTTRSASSTLSSSSSSSSSPSLIRIIPLHPRVVVVRRHHVLHNAVPSKSSLMTRFYCFPNDVISMWHVPSHSVTPFW